MSKETHLLFWDSICLCCCWNDEEEEPGTGTEEDCFRATSGLWVNMLVYLDLVHLASLIKRSVVLCYISLSPMLTVFRLTRSCGSLCVDRVFEVLWMVLIYVICIGVNICCLFAFFFFLHAFSAPNLPSKTALGFQLSWKHWHILRYHFSFIYCKWWFVSCLLPEHLSSFV